MKQLNEVINELNLSIPLCGIEGSAVQEQPQTQQGRLSIPLCGIPSSLLVPGDLDVIYRYCRLSIPLCGIRNLRRARRSNYKGGLSIPLCGILSKVLHAVNPLPNRLSIPLCGIVVTFKMDEKLLEEPFYSLMWDFIRGHH